MQKTMLAAERDGGNACRAWDFAEPAITECGVPYASHSCHSALVDVRRTSSAAVREVITKRRKTLLPVCKLLCWERSAFGQQSAIIALSGLVSRNVKALLKGRPFEGKYRDTITRCGSTAQATALGRFEPFTRDRRAVTEGWKEAIQAVRIY
jgi:hypothetical protein